MRFATCGLPLALSAMLSAAVRGPLAEGVNVTPIVQLAPAATELPQVFAISAKSPPSAPAIERLVILNTELPPLVTVIVCAVPVMATGWLPNERLAGERLTTGATPVPERLAVWGLPLALSVMLSEAVRLPLAEGVKVTPIVQLPPLATELPQVLV